jgi:RNA polymerase sigma factor (sigma-70 family)
VRPSNWWAPDRAATSSSPAGASCSTEPTRAPGCNQTAPRRVLTDVAQAVTDSGERPFYELALTGDEAAFEALIGPLVEPALRLAHSMLGDRWEAEDATQEAITRAWRKLGQLRPGMPVRPWFLAIVINQCRNIRRTKWFKTARIAEVFQGSRPAHADIERVDVARALARLPNQDRQALFLHFYLDLPVEEVAAALGISTSAAKARIYRACHRLRPDLQEEK